MRQMSPIHLSWEDCQTMPFDPDCETFVARLRELNLPRYETMTPQHDRNDWRISPLLAENFSKLPPSYVLTAGFDPLADEGAAYAARLSQGGVPVFHRHFPGQIHGFLTMGSNFPTTERALFDIGRWIQGFG
jgi:acetyl esterase/lipase